MSDIIFFVTDDGHLHVKSTVSIEQLLKYLVIGVEQAIYPCSTHDAEDMLVAFMNDLAARNGIELNEIEED